MMTDLDSVHQNLFRPSETNHSVVPWIIRLVDDPVLNGLVDWARSIILKAVFQTLDNVLQRLLRLHKNVRVFAEQGIERILSPFGLKPIKLV